jgi:hypothetical protein
MHVLVTEARFGDADRLARRLREAGARVSMCHDRAGYCRVLRPGGRCPLDAITDPADLVVDVRGAGEDLTVREYGVVCAVRAMRDVVVVPADPGIPVVVPAGLADVATGMTEEQFLEMYRQGVRTREAARAGWAGRPPRGVRSGVTAAAAPE